MKSTQLTDKMLGMMSAEQRAPLGKAGVTYAEANAKAEVRSEKQLQTLCENYARQHGIPFFRQRMDRKSNMKIGTPDAFMCVRGQFVAIEFKVGKNQLTQEQADCLRDIVKNGGDAVIVRTFQEFVELLAVLRGSEPL